MREYEKFEQEIKVSKKNMHRRGPFPFLANMADNYEKLIGMLRKKDRNINPLDAPRPAIVTGSGPSLDVAKRDLNRLRDVLGAHLFCAPSQLWSLLYSHIRPNFVVAHDPWPQTTKYLSLEAYCEADTMAIGNSSSYLDFIPVITHPGINPGVIAWPAFETFGQLFLHALRPENDPEYKKIPYQPFEIVETMGIYLYHANSRLEGGHPVEHTILMCPNTTLQSAMIAAYLGYRPIYLVGYDLCWWRNVRRFQTLLPNGQEDGTITVPPDVKVKDGECGYPVQSDMIYGKFLTLMYALKYSALQMVEVVVDGEPGNVGGLERAYFQELLDGWTHVCLPFEQRRNRIAWYLAQHGYPIQGKQVVGV